MLLFLLLLKNLLFLSIICSLIYYISEKFNQAYVYRLYILKSYIIIFWGINFLFLFKYFYYKLTTKKVILDVGFNWQEQIKSLDQQTDLLTSMQPSMLQTIFIIYILGLSFFLIKYARQYFKMRTLLLNSTPNRISGVAIRETDTQNNIFSFGVLNPQIFISKNLIENTSGDDMKVVLEHEMFHIRYFDPIWKLVSLLTRNLLFFTPSAYYLHHSLEENMEYMCDNRTILKLNLSIHKYGNILIDMASKMKSTRSNQLFTYIAKTNLKRRIISMKSKTTKKYFLQFFAGLILLVSSMTVIATESEGNENDFYRIMGRVVVDDNIVVDKFMVGTFVNHQARIHIDRNEEKLVFEVLPQNSMQKNHVYLQIKLRTNGSSLNLDSTSHIDLPIGQESTISFQSPSQRVVQLKLKAVKN